VESKVTRTYKTRTGVTFTLRPINPMTIYQLQNDKWGMPQPPILEVEIGGKGHKRKEANPDDPDYKEALRVWTEARGNRFIKYVWERGIEDEPNTVEKARLKEFLPGGTAADHKYLWVMEQLADENEVGEITAAIVGQTAPTEEGVAEAEAAFPSNGERE
jgi:hypothetical protein